MAADTISSRGSLNLSASAPKSRAVRESEPEALNDNGNMFDSNNNNLKPDTIQFKNEQNASSDTLNTSSSTATASAASTNTNTNNTNNNNTNNNNTTASRISSTIIDCTQTTNIDNNNNNNNNSNNNSNNNNNLSELEELSPRAFEFIRKHAASKGMKKVELLTQPISFVGENSYGAIMQICIKNLDQEQQQQSNKLQLNTITQIDNNNNQIDNNNNNNNSNNNSSDNSDNSDNGKKSTEDLIYVVKISPKNPARRAQMLVVDFYVREVFMYNEVFSEFYKLYDERKKHLQEHGHEIADFDHDCYGDLQQQKKKKITSIDCREFDAVPKMYFASLELNDEFIVFEDLRLRGYEKNCRMHMPTYDLVINAFRAIAQLHSMSFVLQAYKPEVFDNLTQQMKENLFSQNMDQLTLDFGRYYVKRIKELIRQDHEQTQMQLKLDILAKIEQNFKSICTNSVCGANAAPYSVICHGDFWNNNILYKYDANHRAISAKLIDFQISRYAPPVLDLVHYLFACTEKELRDKYFMDFMNFYHHSLSQYLEDYDLSIEQIYPRHIFLQQLRDYGVYGLCISAFGIPFFIANTSEYPDFDQTATALSNDTASRNNVDDNNNNNTKDDLNNNNNSDSSEESKISQDQSKEESAQCTDEQYLEILSERTLPIFKRRMTGIVEDLIQYDMIANVLQL